MPVKALATLYLAATLVARLAVAIAAVIEFGRRVVPFVVIALLLRVAMAMLRCKNAYTMKGGAKQAAADFGLGALLDGALTFLVPLGTRATELHKGGMLTLMGAALDPIVDDRLVSPWALGNLALTLVENGLGWCCIILAAGSSTASASSPIIPLWFFHLFGLLPMGAALVLLALKRLAAASEQFGLSEEEMSLGVASQTGKRRWRGS